MTLAAPKDCCSMAILPSRDSNGAGCSGSAAWRFYRAATVMERGAVAQTDSLVGRIKRESGEDETSSKNAKGEEPWLPALKNRVLVSGLATLAGSS
jgi:hypothetical protein